MKKLHLISLGCTKNLVDSEVMLGKLKDYELVDDAGSADVIIINTCGFIDAAKSESINTILSIHQARKKESILVVAGCLSERYKDELIKELPEVDIFTGVGDYFRIDELIEQKKSIFSPNKFLISEEDRVITGSNLHAYIKISEGCNQTCSFCAIPTFKGKLKSRPIDQVVNEVKRLIDRGFVDFSFISQDSSSYLRDMGKSDGLIRLIDEIEKIDKPISARILYLYPSTTTEMLIDRIADSKIFLNYFDMPIQHISQKMLKVMKRGANKERHIRLLQKMKELPNSFIRTSLIIGHPMEEEEDINELCSFLEEFNFDRINIFAYSDEENTSSFYLKPKIDAKTIKKRIKKVEKIVKETTKKSLKKMLKQKVLAIIETKSIESSYFYSARPLIFAPEIDGEVLINDSNIDDKLKGIYEIEITSLKGKQLIGKVTKEVFSCK